MRPIQNQNNLPQIASELTRKFPNASGKGRFVPFK
jgi:hypothetical protein